MKLQDLKDDEENLLTEGQISELVRQITRDVDEHRLEVERVIRSLTINNIAEIQEKEQKFVRKLQQMGLQYSDAMLYFNRLVQMLGTMT